MFGNHRLTVLIYWILFIVRYFEVCQTSGRGASVICQRNGFSGSIDNYIDCELDEFTQKLRLLPKPPHCGVFNETSYVPEQIAYLKDFPWTVILQYEHDNGEELFPASGVLINYRYVLTSGLYLSKLQQKRYNMTFKSVRIGEYDTSTDPDCQDDVCNDPVQNIEIEKVITHPEHSFYSSKKDIALIRLKENVTFSDSVAPICLPAVIRRYSETRPGRLVYLSGWGQTRKNTETDQPKVTKKQNIVLNKIDNRRCFRSWLVYGDDTISEFNEHIHVCATSVRQANNCNGFDGGTLMQNENDIWIAEGILTQSALGSLGCYRKASLYGKVSAFRNWIIYNLEP